MYLWNERIRLGVPRCTLGASIVEIIFCIRQTVPATRSLVDEVSEVLCPEGRRWTKLRELERGVEKYTPDIALLIRATLARFVIDEAVEIIKYGTISMFKYDPNSASLVERV